MSKEDDEFHLMSEAFTELRAAYEDSAKKIGESQEATVGEEGEATSPELMKDFLQKNGHFLKFAAKAYFSCEVDASLDLLSEFAQNPLLGARSSGGGAKYAYIKVLHQLAILDIQVNVFMWHAAEKCLGSCPGTIEPGSAKEDNSNSPYIENEAERAKATKIWAAIKKRYNFLRDTCGSDCKKAPIAHAKATSIEASQSSWLLKEDELLRKYAAVHACVVSNPWDLDVLGRVRGMRAMMANAMDTEMKQTFFVTNEAMLQDFEGDMSCAYSDYEGRDLSVYRTQMMRAGLALALEEDRVDQAQRYMDLAEKHKYLEAVMKDGEVRAIWAKVRARKAAGDAAAGADPSKAATDANTAGGDVPLTKAEEEAQQKAMQCKEEGNAFMGQISQIQAQKGKDEKLKQQEVITMAKKAVSCYTQGIEAAAKLTQQNGLLTAHLYGNRSFAFSRLEDYKQGLSDALSAVTAYPGFVKAYYRAGLCARELGDYSHALRMLRMGIVQEREQSPTMERADSKLEQLLSDIVKEEPFKHLPEEGQDSGSAGTKVAGGGGAAAITQNKKEEKAGKKGGDGKKNTPPAQQPTPQISSALPEVPVPAGLMSHQKVIKILDDPIGLDLPVTMTNEEHAKLVVRASVASIIKRYYLSHGVDGHTKDDVENRKALAQASLNWCKNMGTSAISKPQRKKMEKLIDTASTHLSAAIAGENMDSEKAAGAWCKAYFQDCMFVPDSIVEAALTAQLVEYQHAINSKSKKNKELDNQNKKDRKKLQDQAKALEKAKKTLSDITRKEEEVDTQLKDFLESKDGDGANSALDTDPTIMSKREQLKELKASTEELDKEATQKETSSESRIADLQVEAADLKEKLKLAQASHTARIKAMAGRKAELEELRRRNEEDEKKEKEMKERRAKEAKEREELAKIQAEKDKRKAEQQAKQQAKEEKNKAAKAEKQAVSQAAAAAAVQQKQEQKQAGGTPMTLQELESGLHTGTVKAGITATTTGKLPPPGYKDPTPPVASVPPPISSPGSAGVARSPMTVIPASTSDSIWTVSGGSDTTTPLSVPIVAPPAPVSTGFVVTSSSSPVVTTTPASQQGQRGTPGTQMHKLSGGAKPFMPDASAKAFNPGGPPAGTGAPPQPSMWGAGGSLDSTPGINTTGMIRATATSNKPHHQQQQQPPQQQQQPGQGITTGLVKPKRQRFFMSGTILASMWDDNTASELADEYPGVEFDVHKPKVGKKASITIVATSRVMLREVVDSLQSVVQEALVLDEEVYRELANGESEVVSQQPPAPASGMGTPSHSTGSSVPQTLHVVPQPAVQPQQQQQVSPFIGGISATKAPGSGTSPTQQSAPNTFSIFGSSGSDSLLGGSGGAFGGGSAGVGAPVAPAQQQQPDATADWLQSALSAGADSGTGEPEMSWLRGVIDED